MSLALRTPLATIAKGAQTAKTATPKPSSTTTPVATAPKPAAPKTQNPTAAPRMATAMMRPDLAEANGSTSWRLNPDNPFATSNAALAAAAKANLPTTSLNVPTAPSVSAFTPPAAPAVLPDLPAIQTGPGSVNMTSPLANASGAGAQTGVPAWQTLLSQMPGFGGPGGMGGGLFGGGMGQGQGQGQGLGQIQNALANFMRFANPNMGSPMSQASSLRLGQGGQGLGGPGGPGAGAQMAGGRAQAPVLGQGRGTDMLQQLMQQLQGGNQTRFQNAFRGANAFPFAQLLSGGSGFSSGFNPMAAMRSSTGMGLGGMGGGGFGGGQLDPRAMDMRKLLMGSLFGNGGGGGGLDVN